MVKSPYLCWDEGGALKVALSKCQEQDGKKLPQFCSDQSQLPLKPDLIEVVASRLVLKGRA